VIDELTLTAGDGSQLVIFLVYKHPEGEHLEADAYVAQKAQPEGTVYTVPAGEKVVHLRAENPIREGFWAFPGDPEAFGQLAERALFFQQEVIGATEEAAG
jgi:hypothetical protein